MTPFDPRWLRVTTVLGVLACVSYLVATQVPISPAVNYGFFFAFGPLLAATGLGLFRFLQRGCDGVRLQMASLFMVLAGAAVTMMATMQATLRTRFADLRAAGLDPEPTRAVLRLVDASQLGVDIAFDLFVATATFLLGTVLWRAPRFGPLWGACAMVVGVCGLAFNMLTFPDNPGTAGLIDPGPLFGVFFAAFTIRLLTLWRGAGPALGAAAVLCVLLPLGACADRERLATEQAGAALHGKAAPPLTGVELLQGSASPFAGRITVLNFWSRTCPPCIDELPLLREFHRENASATLQVVGVTRDARDAAARDAERAAVRDVLTQHDVDFPIALAADSANHRAYAVRYLPTTILVGADARVVDWGIGEAATRRMLARARQLARDT